jgi:hypothetical protein
MFGEFKLDGIIATPSKRPWPRVDSKHKTAAYKAKQKRKKANRKARKRFNKRFTEQESNPEELGRWLWLLDEIRLDIGEANFKRLYPELDEDQRTIVDARTISTFEPPAEGN